MISPPRPWMPYITTRKLEIGNPIIIIIEPSSHDGHFSLPRFKLSPEEASYTSTIIHPRQRESYIIARGILRYLVAWLTEKKLHNIHIVRADTGKPFITGREDGTDIQFNISYTDELLCIGLSLGYKIGIDVERRRSVRHQVDISNYAFSKSESEWISSLDQSCMNGAFLRTWTRKEAVLKCFGGTVAQHMHSFSVPRCENAGKWVLSSDQLEGLQHPVSLMDFECLDQYIGSVCWEGSYTPPSHYIMTPDALKDLVGQIDP